VQRMFSTFPGARPGVGLLLLRTTIGFTLITQGIAYFVDWHDLRLITSTIALMAMASGAMLLIGYLTPFASVVAALISVGDGLWWFQAPSWNLFDTRMAVSLTAIIALSIVCLGPGAFSIDARLFGRREIFIPEALRTPKS
jgi:uncharacterized membrane protein YphA (DoxX/SURF4 family)